LVLLGSSPHRLLHRPTDLVQDTSYLREMVLHTVHALDHHSYTLTRPHICGKAKGWCSLLEQLWQFG
jgi:hypothetical protein